MLQYVQRLLYGPGAGKRPEIPATILLEAAGDVDPGPVLFDIDFKVRKGLIVHKANVVMGMILLDEIDRVTDEGRASIMGVLVELLDPEQNAQFTDHYLDYPFDLSEVLFTHPRL